MSFFLQNHSPGGTLINMEQDKIFCPLYDAGQLSYQPLSFMLRGLQQFTFHSTNLPRLLQQPSSVSIPQQVWSNGKFTEPEL